MAILTKSASLLYYCSTTLLRILDFLGLSEKNFKLNQNFSSSLFPLEVSWDVLRGEAHGEDEIEGLE